MKKIFVVLALTILIFSCSKERGNMLVKGQIKGLKKGTLYLQKMNDTIIVSVDSIQLFDSNEFLLSDNVASPEMYYLTYSGNKDRKRLMFFGEPGEIVINDNIDEFGFSPDIKGSKNQEIMDKFNEFNQKFKYKRLDFIADKFEARSKNDSMALNTLELEYKKMLRKRYLFTTNFAITHKNSEVAPYLALSELSDANLYLLDTINNSLSNHVKNSTYGKRFQKFLSNAKKNESAQE